MFVKQKNQPNATIKMQCNKEPKNSFASLLFCPKGNWLLELSSYQNVFNEEKKVFFARNTFPDLLDIFISAVNAAKAAVKGPKTKPIPRGRKLRAKKIGRNRRAVLKRGPGQLARLRLAKKQKRTLHRDYSPALRSTQVQQRPLEAH